MMSFVGVIDEVILEAKLVRDDTPPGEFVKPADVIGGLEGYHLYMQRHVPLDQSKICQLIASGDTQELEFDGFSVGSVLVLRCVRVCVHTCVHVFLCVHVYVHAYVCVCVCVCVHTYTHLCLCMCIFVVISRNYVCVCYHYVPTMTCLVLLLVLLSSL